MIIANALDAQKKGDLTGGALTDEVADSSSSIYRASRGVGAIKGLQQHFTPRPVANFVADVLGRENITLDLTAGTGDMISPFTHRYGIEIDRDHTKAPLYDAIQGDAQKVVPIIRATDMRFDRIAINPPFGLDDWKDDAHRDGRPTNSTLLTYLWSIDLLGHYGAGAMLCGTGRLDREVLRHPASKAIVAVVDITGPTFDGVQLPCSVSFFIHPRNIKPGYTDQSPLRMEVQSIHDLEGTRRGAISATAYDIRREIRYRARTFYDFAPAPYLIKQAESAWKAIRGEYKRRQDEAANEKSEHRFDVTFSGDKLYVYPRAYTKLILAKQGRLRSVETLNGQSINYFGQNKRSWDLLMLLEEEGTLTVDPALKAKLDSIIKEAELASTPLFPLKPQMRLGWMVDLDQIKCTKSDPERGFKAGETYKIETSTPIVTEKTEKVDENRKTGEPTVRWFTLERKVLQVRITGEDGVQLFNESAQDVMYLIRHFDLPDPGDVATKYPEKVQALRDLIEEIEVEVKVNYAKYMLEVEGEVEFKPFAFKDFQKDHMSRLLTKERGLLAHEQGLGKTLQLMTLTEATIRLGAKNKALFVVPQDLIPQWQREAKKFFGRELKEIRNPEDARACRRELENGGTGWYITYFEAMSLTGKKEELLPEVPLSGYLHYRTIGYTMKGEKVEKLFQCQSLRERLEQYKLVKAHRKKMGLLEPEAGATSLPTREEVVQAINLSEVKADRTADDDDYRLEATSRDACPRCAAREDTVRADAGWKQLQCHQCGYVHRKRWHKPGYAYLTRVFIDGVKCVDELSQIRGDSRRSKAIRGIARGPHNYGATGTPLSNYINDAFWGLWFSLGNATTAFPYAYEGGKTKFEQDFCVLEHVSGPKGSDTEHKRIRTSVKAMVTNVSQFWRLAQPGVSRCRKEHTGEPIVERTWHPTRVPMGVVQRKQHQFWLFNFSRYFTEKNPNHKLVQYGLVEQWEAMLGQRWKLEYAATAPAEDRDLQEWDFIRSKQIVTNPQTGEETQVERFPWHDSISNWTPANIKVLETAIKHVEKGEKVLIGSDLVATGYWLSQRLNEKGIRAVHLAEERDGKLTTKNPKKRSAGVSEFVNGDAQVMCVGINAMKLGHNMEKAQCVIVNGLPDSFEAIDQFVARVHRLTSKHPVNVYVVLPKGSLSETKWDLLRDKGGSSDLAFDGELSLQQEEEIDWRKVLKELKEKGVKAQGDEILESDVEAEWRNITYTPPIMERVPNPVPGALIEKHYAGPEVPKVQKVQKVQKPPIGQVGQVGRTTPDQPDQRVSEYKPRDYAHKCGLVVFQPEPFGSWHFKDGADTGVCENGICPYCEKPIKAQDLRDPKKAEKAAKRGKSKPAPAFTDGLSMFEEDLTINEDAVVLSLF